MLSTCLVDTNTRDTSVSILIETNCSMHFQFMDTLCEWGSCLMVCYTEASVNCGIILKFVKRVRMFVCPVL